jgi:hypothetical protein
MKSSQSYWGKYRTSIYGWFGLLIMLFLALNGEVSVVWYMYVAWGLSLLVEIAEERHRR